MPLELIFGWKLNLMTLSSNQFGFIGFQEPHEYLNHDFPIQRTSQAHMNFWIFFCSVPIPNPNLFICKIQGNLHRTPRRSSIDLDTEYSCPRSAELHKVALSHALVLSANLPPWGSISNSFSETIVMWESTTVRNYSYREWCYAIAIGNDAIQSPFSSAKNK